MPKGNLVFPEPEAKEDDPAVKERWEIDYPLFNILDDHPKQFEIAHSASQTIDKSLHLMFKPNRFQAVPI